MEHVGWPQVRQGRGAFFSMLRRFARLFIVLLLGVVTSSILSMLDEFLGEVNEGGHDCVAALLLSSSLPAFDTDDFERKLPTLLRKRRSRLPSSFTFPILIPPSPFVAALRLATGLGAGLQMNFCNASR